MEKLGAAVLEHGSEAVKDKFVELRIVNVVKNPRFPIMTIFAHLESQGVEVQDSLKQIVAGLYKAALDSTGRTAHDEDKMTLVLKHKDFRSEYINTGFHTIKTIVEQVNEQLTNLMEKYEEIKFDEITELEAQVIMYQGVAGTTRKRSDGWCFYTSFNELENKSGDVIVIPKVLQALAKHTRPEQFQFLCVPLGLLFTQVRYLNPKTFMKDHVTQRRTFKFDSNPYHRWLRDGPTLNDIDEANALRILADVPNDGPCRFPEDLNKYATHLNCYIHIIDRSCGNSVTYLGIPASHNSLQHRYLYQIEDHVHAVQRPEKLLANFKTGMHNNGNYLCDFCYYTSKSKECYKKHLDKCSKSGMAAERSADNIKRGIYTQWKKQAFRSPFKQEPKRGKFCLQCKDFVQVSITYLKHGSVSTDESALNNEESESSSEDGKDNEEEKMQARRDDQQNEWLNACIAAKHDILDGSVVICTACMNPCLTILQESHKCYCSRPVESKVKDDNVYWFFDFESVPIKTAKIGRPTHVVIFGVLQNHDGSRTIEVHSIEEFCAVVFNDPQFNKCTFISHNGGKYDMQLIFGFLLSQGAMPKFITHHGSPSKLLELDFMKRRFIDSINFITLPLSAFGKTFGLKSAKGDYPHAFASHLVENLPDDSIASEAIQLLESYTGTIPAIEYYNVGSCKGASQAATDEAVRSLGNWHANEFLEHQCDWNALNELKKYCRQDVVVLREGCMKYRKEFLGIEMSVGMLHDDEDCWKPRNIDPFAYLTQSQVCMALFLLGLPLKTRISHFPAPSKHGWSKKSIVWLTWMEKKLGFNIVEIT